ncbi:hypothetical protein [Paenibacillus daejeonensis]|uniref:hypothetical protein n=1 Tax=Paenibacillus daejeonensis TaxID=135193 RepID=UPI00035D0018|nr:hypothetical protein [Paenibacillus daejeonensis]
MNTMTRHYWLVFIFAVLAAGAIYLLEKAGLGQEMNSMQMGMTMYVVFLFGGLAIPFYGLTIMPVSLLLDKLPRGQRLWKLLLPTLLMMGMGYWLGTNYIQDPAMPLVTQPLIGLILFGAVGLLIQLLDWFLVYRYPVEGSLS